MAKIKSKKTFEIVYEGEEEVGKYLKEAILFSPLGDILNRKAYNEEEQMVSEISNVYQDKKLTEQKNINAFEGIDQRTEYRYDADKIVSAKEFYNANDFIETTYTYNKENKLFQISKIDNEKESHGKVAFEYDPTERVTRETHFNSFDEESYELETTHDEKGNDIEVIERNFKGPDDYTEKVEAYEFNDQRDLIAATITFEGKLIFTVQNTRDEKGLLIKQERTDHLTSMETEMIFSYDEEGKRIKEEEYQNGELEKTKDILYDTLGNVIEETVSSRLHEDVFEETKELIELEYYEN